MSGAVSNDSQLTKHLNWVAIMWVIRTMFTKGWFRSAGRNKWPILFKAQGALVWTQAISIPKPPIQLWPIALGSYFINWFLPSDPESSTGAPKWTLSITSTESGKEVPFLLSADLNHPFVNIVLITHMIATRFRCFVSWEPLLTAPDMTLVSRGCQYFGVSLFWCPLCYLGVVLLTSEWSILTVEQLTFI